MICRSWIRKRRIRMRKRKGGKDSMGNRKRMMITITMIAVARRKKCYQDFRR